MRRILIASVLLSPLFFTPSAVASQTATEAAASTPVRPISTGVKQARVLDSPNIDLPASANLPNDTEFVLKLNVDENGKPQDVEVVKSLNPDVDASVAAAVRQFRFRPATLDKQPIATDMTLTVVMER
jgi:TonB family protein